MGLKALLVGINAYSVMPLRGCVNDIQRMRDLLTQQYGLNDDDDHLRVLLDSAATKDAIADGLRWLALPDTSTTPPVRLFHFSGHGTQQADTNGDEPDGMDECLVPYDFQSGFVHDDMLKELYSTFPSETHLVLTMDCCHSGTLSRSFEVLYRYMPPSFDEMQRIGAAARRFAGEQDQFVREHVRDMRHRADISDGEFEQQIQDAQEKFHKKRFGQEEVPGMAVLIAASRSDQTAADARFGDKYYGALTYYLTETLGDMGGSLSYEQLVDQVGRKLYDHKFLQVPQLEASKENFTRPFLKGTAETGESQPEQHDDDARPFTTFLPFISSGGGARQMGETMPAQQDPEPAAAETSASREWTAADGLLPHETGVDEDFPMQRNVTPAVFLYDGYGLMPDQFTTYVQDYNFGTHPPDFVVLHHTGTPGTRHAHTNPNHLWDAGEEELSDEMIYQKRQEQLKQLREHYRIQRGWDRGPHIFIDDRYIWLFTPMFRWSLHALGANTYTAHGKQHYAISVVVIGDYTTQRWPEPVERLVGHTVAALKHRLDTFELRYRRLAGGISSHRDYNNPDCPGNAITNDYYIGVINEGWQQLRSHIV